MIGYSLNDFVLVEVATRKELILVTTAGDDSRGILETSRVTGENLIVDFEPHQVVSNLGARPKLGSSYGVKVEPFVKSFDTDLGQCDVYFLPAQPKAFKEEVEEAATGMAALLKQWKMSVLSPVQLEMRYTKGTKTRGMFHALKGRGELDLIVCRHQDGLLPYLLAHEFGHSIWFRKIRNSIKAKWVRKYHTGAIVEHVDSKTCAALMRDMLDYEDMIPSEYAGALDEEDASAYERCLAWIEYNHGIRPKDLDVLRLDDDEAKIEELWPQHVTVADMETLVTEYGMKNAEEFWCECLANYVIGKLSDDLHTMVERTLAAAGKAQ